MPDRQEAMPGGIGVLNENSIHSGLKSYVEPDVSRHEVGVDGYIVDIMRDDGIYEIQSRHFYRMKHKLTQLLRAHKVTVVYPVVRTKWITWMEESGEVVCRRKSPKMGMKCHILAELYGIRELLAHENLSFAVARLDAEDCRLAAQGKKCGRRGKGRDRLACVPLKWIDITWFGATRARGLGELLPELADEFTSWEFARLCHLSRKVVHRAMKVLSDASIIECIGKKGRLLLYRVMPEVSSESGRS